MRLGRHMLVRRGRSTRATATLTTKHHRVGPSAQRALGRMYGPTARSVRSTSGKPSWSYRNSGVNAARQRTALECACSQAAAVTGSSSTPVEASDVRSPGSPSTTAPQADVWELDFCSRPLLDERKKKVWELLICDPSGAWQFSRYFPNNKINSTELKSTLKEVLAMPGATKPTRALFFRGQMQTIISRALDDLEIKPVPSRRCFALMSLLEERLETVYKQDERYSDKASTMFQLDLAPPADLADALRGEQWAFVQLPLSSLQDESAQVAQAGAFGESLPDLDRLGLSEDTPIPGVAVFSSRAKPLAAWTNGLELACLKADTDRACLLLEAGVRERYRYGAWRSSPAANGEAEEWEAAKQASRGVHFLAVQRDPEADQCDGLWVLRETPPPTV